jgi:hypothetical protein
MSSFFYAEPASASDASDGSSSSSSSASSASADNAAEPVLHAPDDLDGFRADVRTWLEMDNTIHILQDSLRERKDAKRKLTNRILTFMTEHNIVDLATRFGRLRFQVEYIRKPLSHKTIRSRISDFYSSNAEAAQELSGAVFGNRQRCERVALRRLT